MGRWFAACAFIFILSMAPPNKAFGQNSYPTRPVKFLVPYPSGGTNDVLARIVGDKLQAKLTLTDTSHSGEQVTITVDGNPNSVTINGNRAQLVINNPALGQHTVELTNPAGCFAPVVTSCN